VRWASRWQSPWSFGVASSAGTRHAGQENAGMAIGDRGVLFGLVVDGLMRTVTKTNHRGVLRGVQVFQPGGHEYVVASDRTVRLCSFEYTGP